MRDKTSRLGKKAGIMSISAFALVFSFLSIVFIFLALFYYGAAMFWFLSVFYLNFLNIKKGEILARHTTSSVAHFLFAFSATLGQERRED